MEEDAVELNKKIDELTLTVNRLSNNFENYVSSSGNVNPYSEVSHDNGAVSSKEVDRPSYDDIDDFTQDFSKDENEERGNWSGRLDFILSCLGYAVGLGNVWRFPYLCYINGGAVFFIPYCIMLFFVGIPIFFLEVSLGQYTSRGPVESWNCARLFSGIGVGMAIVCGLVAIYYNMIIAWSLFYLFASFTSKLPWSECDREWATDFCEDFLMPNMTATDCEQQQYTLSNNGVCYNGTTPLFIWDEDTAREHGIKKVLATEAYLHGYVWGRSDRTIGVSELGYPRWQLVLCYLLAWILVSVSLIKGIKSSGKVVYFTALFPYAVLVILLIRGVLLEGHYKGIEFYILKPDISKLSEAKVWKDAAVQIFFSLSASQGGLIALSSYNRFHNDCLRDSLIVSIGNCLTSFFAGFVIFSYLGFLATELNVEVPEVVDSGVGLAFTVYTYAVTRMPISPLWAILFFLMLITLGMDSQFVFLETISTVIMDRFPQTRKRKYLLIFGFSFLFFLLGLTLCCPGGSYLLTLIDNYSAGWNVLLIAFLECICIGYVYGAFRYKEDIRTMIGNHGCSCFPWDCCAPWWILCWCLFTPLGVLFILVFSWVDFKPPTDGDYAFPQWADALGWMMTITVVVGMVGYALFLFCIESGSIGERFYKLMTPSRFWGPDLVQHRRLVRHLKGFVVDPRSTDNIEMGDKRSYENKGYD